ncbi:polysaccharide biosynthesis/export family protein [Rhizobium sp. BK376]|jgi:polysaccharide export outer membrane protein|uniref:polysaccharide biosynthesis/export family protein n=1 Tax=Rhizobium sp. BK376 TaxID=2512149 RepID=UPI0014048896|nr:polysaccharide biosynthesis/export family protein [Rhizobium sp. BK376]
MSSSGPSAGDILSEAGKTYAPYTVVEVTPAVVRVLSGRVDQQLAVTFGNTRKKSSSLIGVGDDVVVSIWEASNNGLFASGTTTARTMGGTQVPQQPVSESGTITVPYAGTIKAANKTPDQVKLEIESALKGVAVEPQVLVSVVKNVSNTVTVTGEVATSGLIPLSARGEKLLDVIAMAGGPRMEAHQLAVQITRGLHTETIPMERLISDPVENIYVQSGDVITLLRQPRSFTVFGATTANASVQFDEAQLYLNQALAKVGGLNDDRANAKGIFIYRTEPVSLVRQLMPGKPISGAGDTANVIYRIDLSDPSGFFLLKSFSVRNRDLIYIANSSMAEVRKFATIIGATTAPVVQAAAASNALQN